MRLQSMIFCHRLQGRSPRCGVRDCWASPVTAEGKIFVLSEDGKAGVVKAGAAWEVMSIEELDEVCYATPAFTAGLVKNVTISNVFGART